MYVSKEFPPKGNSSKLGLAYISDLHLSSIRENRVDI